MAAEFDWPITALTIQVTITEQYAQVLIVWLQLIRQAGNNRENALNVCISCLKLVPLPRALSLVLRWGQNNSSLDWGPQPKMDGSAKQQRDNEDLLMRFGTFPKREGQPHPQRPCTVPWRPPWRICGLISPSSCCLPEVPFGFRQTVTSLMFTCPYAEDRHISGWFRLHKGVNIKRTRLLISSAPQIPKISPRPNDPPVSLWFPATFS